MADENITLLPAGAAVSDADLFYSVQSSTDVKVTASQLKTYVGDRTVEVAVTNPNGDSLTTGDGQMYFMVPPALDGYILTEVAGYLSAVSTSGTPTIQIRNATDAVDMLSTAITIDANQFNSLNATIPPVIDTSHDDVVSGDRIAFDIDVAGTGAKGLFISMKFSPA